MSANPENTNRPCWFVGAMWGEAGDQSQRFIADGVWENGYDDRYLDQIKAVKPGDRIAIKAAYTRKYDLPFDNKGQTVSVMAIKAIGSVLDNPGDGRHLKVNWLQVNDPPREWYFFTSRPTVWQVMPGEWITDALIRFAFDNQGQDINRFRNAPAYRERFGDNLVDKQEFGWTVFYEEIANQILEYKNRHGELVNIIHTVAAKVPCMTNLNDKFADGTSGPLKDICPFTAMGVFNRNLTDNNRIAIATELAIALDVKSTPPSSFESIPLLNNQKSWFFGYSKDKQRQPDDIAALWDIYEKAIFFADQGGDAEKDAFVDAYNNAAGRFGVGWNLTMGLYWIRPWFFSPLDGQSRNYIEKRLGLDIPLNGPKSKCSGQDYLELLGMLNARFREDTFPVHSFPDMSLNAWMAYKDDGKAPEPDAAGADLDINPAIKYISYAA